MTRHRLTIVTLGLALAFATPASAGDESRDDDSVSREEFDELRRAHEALRREMSTLREEQPPSNMTALEAAISSLEQEVDWVTARTDAWRPGERSFVVNGFTRAGYSNPNNDNSSFSAGFFPVFVYRLDDRLLFEAELHVMAGSGGTGVELSYAHTSYIVGDALTLGAGKFLSPFGTFQERLHPAWINKLPSNPLVYAHGAGIAPEAMTGVQARGAMRLGETDGKFTYAAWVTNGPSLSDANTLAGDAAAAAGGHDAHKAPVPPEFRESLTGRLDFDDGGDSNGNKTFGTRLAYLPVPWIEIGGSYWAGDADPTGSIFEGGDFRLTGLDLVVQHRDVESIGGNLEFRAEYIESDVDNGHLPFNNRRSGGYAQVAYRPQQLDATVLNDLEFAVRHDWLKEPGGVDHLNDIDVWTVGVSYWLSTTAAVKVAVQKKDVERLGDESSVVFELAMGF